MTNTRERFVATAPIFEGAIARLETVAPVEISPSTDEETMLGLLDNTIGIVCRGEGKVTARMIAGCPTLKVIGRPGAGFDSVDLVTATSRNIPLVYAPVGGFAVAEGAMAMLLAIAKELLILDRHVREGRWEKRYETMTSDLTEKTMGIIGLGRIGSYLARLLQPFDMKLLGYDPVVTSEAAAETGVQWVPLEELLARADFVSVHVPLNDSTRGLINAERLAAMKPGAILINTSRGAIVENLDVVADALESGRLGGAGLDVFPQQPPDSSHRIFQHPRLLCSPHVAGISALAWQRVSMTMADGMVAVLEGKHPEYCVNPEVFS